MPHCPEEVGDEGLELAFIHETDLLEASGELPGGRGRGLLPQIKSHPHDDGDGEDQESSTEEPLEITDQPDVVAPHDERQRKEREDRTLEDYIRLPSSRPGHRFSLAPSGSSRHRAETTSGKVRRSSGGPKKKSRGVQAPPDSGRTGPRNGPARKILVCDYLRLRIA
jgi:hypothetical protein